LKTEPNRLFPGLFANFVTGPSAAPALGPGLSNPGRGSRQHGGGHLARGSLIFWSHPSTPRGRSTVCMQPTA